MFAVVCTRYHVTVTSFGSSCHALGVLRHTNSMLVTRADHGMSPGGISGVKASTSFPVAKHRLDEIFYARPANLKQWL